MVRHYFLTETISFTLPKFHNYFTIFLQIERPQTWVSHGSLRHNVANCPVLEKRKSECIETYENAWVFFLGCVKIVW